ncbi:MAG TPA: sialidase family protein [Polyangiaceae bacterium]
MLAALSVAPLCGALSAGCDGCSPSSGPSGPTKDAASDATGGDAGPEGASEGGPTEGGSLTVSPTTANVLTCGSLQLTATGGTGSPAWSVSPSSGAGSVSSSGDYAAPTVAPASPGVTVTCTEGAQMASASLQVATGFPGAPVPVPIGGNTSAPGSNVPFEHVFSASGSTIYAGVQGPLVDNDSGGQAYLDMQVYSSTDNGKTFTGPTQFHTGNLSCGTVAVDPGDASVVYLVYTAGHGDSTSNTGTTVRLAVSTDGAKTFPNEYVIADNVNGLSNLICPDVSSPSPDHVIVTAVGGTWVDGDPTWAATWVSGNRGANIGPVAGDDGLEPANPDGGTYSGSDTNGGTAQSCDIASNGNGWGPRVFSNGKGDACVVYEYEGSCAPTYPSPAGEIFVQCSTNSGTTWTAPLPLVGPSPTGMKSHPTGSVSPSGNVAVTWIDSVFDDAGTGLDQVFVAISKNGGTTFGKAIQYVLPPSLGDSYTTGDPVVAWENDDVLWLSQTIPINNGPSILVDKTCDDGATWSGAVSLGPGYATSPFVGLAGSSLIATTAGMMVGGYVSAGSGTPMIVLLPLSHP